MKEAFNISPTAITNTSENPENLLCYPLRHIYDNLTYPEISLKVCLSGPPEDRAGFPQWLGRAGCKIVNDPLKADLVIFTGGPDVNPKMYGENPLKETHVNAERDAEDNALWDICREHRIPMVGICRGAQFLWVKEGGLLFQDVNNHNDGEHEILYFAEGQKYLASSVHHQMCRPTAGLNFKLLASTQVSTKRKTPAFIQTGANSDFEIFCFEKKAILGIQGHPEYSGYPNYSELCIRLIDKYIYDNTNTSYINGLLRLRKDKK